MWSPQYFYRTNCEVSEPSEKQQYPHQRCADASASAQVDADASFLSPQMQNCVQLWMRACPTKVMIMQQYSEVFQIEVTVVICNAK